MGISLMLMLCLAFLFPGSLGYASRPSWATLMGDTAPEDIGQISNLSRRTRSYLLDDHLLPSFAQVHVTVSSVEVIYRNGPALCLLSGLLLVAIYVCSKARRRWRKKMSHLPPAFWGTHSYNRNIYSICEDLYRLEANVILMRKVIRRLLLSYPKAGRTNGKKRKWRDVEEEERHSPPVYPTRAPKSFWEGIRIVPRE